jgi:hypothetical protein
MMAAQFQPKNFLRMVSNVVLRAFFARHEALADLNWMDLKENEIGLIFKAWQELPEAKRTEIEQVFEAVEELASAKGLRTIFEEAGYHGIDLHAELSTYINNRDKLLYVAMEHPRVFEVAHTIHRAHTLSTRYMKRRPNMPSVEPDVSFEALDRFSGALSAHYQETEGRGRRCHVDTFLRVQRYHYFFAYLDDYADLYLGHNEQGEFVRHPHRPAFEVVFIYDPEDRTLDLYARGDKQLHVALHLIFSEHILRQELPYEAGRSHPYELNVIKSREFLQSTRATDIEDGIEKVQVRKLRLSLKDDSKQRILLEANPDGEPHDIYEMIEKRLNRPNLPDDKFNVSYAQLHFRFVRGATGRQRTMTFELAFPNSSSLKSCNDELRPIAEKYLRKWGIDRSDALRVLEAPKETPLDAEYTLEDVLEARAS